MFTSHPNVADAGYKLTHDIPRLRDHERRLKEWMALACSHLKQETFVCSVDGAGALRFETPMGPLLTDTQILAQGDAFVGRMIFYGPPTPPFRKEAKPVFSLRWDTDGLVRFGDDADAPYMDDHNGSWRPKDLIRLGYELMLAQAAG